MWRNVIYCYMLTLSVHVKAELFQYIAQSYGKSYTQIEYDVLHCIMFTYVVNLSQICVKHK